MSYTTVAIAGPGGVGFVRTQPALNVGVPYQVWSVIENIKPMNVAMGRYGKRLFRSYLQPGFAALRKDGTLLQYKGLLY
ncbi:hypothetical protein DFH06DRAFT_1314042 [Mycena polygramma]|nr:hypothetical protein DFH06DRAFT_1314042 [Mycena polygramma]